MKKIKKRLRLRWELWLLRRPYIKQVINDALLEGYRKARRDADESWGRILFAEKSQYATNERMRQELRNHQEMILKLGNASIPSVFAAPTAPEDRT